MYQENNTSSRGDHIKIYTIGVYGRTETDFFKNLVEYSITLFVDIRARRGMRGAKYSFVNSTYLQERLKELNIKYLHIRDLAPSREARDQQREDDKLLGINKQARHSLSRSFIERYRDECLSHFDLATFIRQFEDENLVFFCVEREPEACHRGIVADELSQLGIKVHHIR
ncbi:MAG: DUF488 domain-containing protein [Alicyclobacillus shizuokensis]|nr:DUF488 domain-containing protein [Alicyclobacillus shizuokensis]